MADPSGSRLQMIFYRSELVFRHYILPGSHFPHYLDENHHESFFWEHHGRYPHGPLNDVYCNRSKFRQIQIDCLSTYSARYKLNLLQSLDGSRCLAAGSLEPTAESFLATVSYRHERRG